MSLKRLAIILDLIYWIATGIREISNAVAEGIKVYRRYKKHGRRKDKGHQER
jgi:hypothetical protein